ncbi:putative glucan endo-1,6-beta-glucosidase B [Fusarium oxysporum f. sp. albedinis]|nr:putative glucan endo-1,6-beta-glucosidase B [Fusarium oxysporum f. sp. albedinis]
MRSYVIVKSFTSLAPPKDPSLFLGCRGQPLCYLTPYSMQVILLEEMHATSKTNIDHTMSCYVITHPPAHSTNDRVQCQSTCRACPIETQTPLGKNISRKCRNSCDNAGGLYPRSQCPRLPYQPGHVFISRWFLQC